MSIQFGPEWRDFDNRLAQYPQVTEAQLRRTLNTSLVLIERDAKRNIAQDTRRLSGSMTHEITGTYPNLVGRVGPSVQYGAYVEFGRRPGRMPPVNALMGWVRRHWAPSAGAQARIGAAQFPGQVRNRSWAAVAARDRARAKARGATPAQVARAGEAALRSRAWALAIAIGRKGVRPQPFLRPAYTRNRPTIEALFARMGLRITGWLAGGPL